MSNFDILKSVWPVLFLLYSNSLFSQDMDHFQYEALYQFEFTPKRGMKPPRGAERLTELVKEIPVILQFNGQRSHYFIDYYPNNMEESIAAITIRATMEYFVKRDGAFIWKYRRFGNTSFVLDTLDIHWKIHPDEKKIINGMTCHFAVGEYSSPYHGNHEIKAWYSEEVPVPFGPFGTGGLPGLIVHLQFRNDTYTLKKLRNLRGQGIKINWPDEEKTISMARYMGMDEEMKDDFLENLDGEQRNKIQKKMK